LAQFLQNALLLGVSHRNGDYKLVRVSAELVLNLINPTLMIPWIQGACRYILVSGFYGRPKYDQSKV